MNPIRRIRDAVRSRRVVKANSVTQELANQLFVNPLCSDYENVFAQVQPYINEMILVQPYGVGRNGGKLASDRTPELTTLMSPNDLMGGVDFMATMFATWLTEDELDIHVHRNPRGKVIGFTILPPGSRAYNSADGEPVWQVTTGDGYEFIKRDEVMQLYFSRSPKNVRQGISPARSIRALAQTQDVLWQYQRAYIQNGAIPASITFIRASSQDKFEAARRELEQNLRGPENKGKTIYVWRQYDNTTGNESDQVEVRTIQGNNSTLAIREISDIINDHLNKAYGVSNFILGDDASAKYDNAELSRHQFLSSRIYPALLSFWNQFQFELDRITGGLGYAISFDLELPELTERKKVKAETAEKNVKNLTDLLNAGAKPEGAVKALELTEDWLEVARSIYSMVLVSQDKNDTKKIRQSKDCCSLYSGNYHNPKISQGEGTSTQDALPEMTANEIKIYNALVEMARKIMESDLSLDEAEVMAKINEVLEQEAIAGEEKGAKALELLTDGDIKAEIQTQIREGLKVSEALRSRISDRTNELVNNYGSETRRLFNETLEANAGKSANEIRKALREVMPTYQAERIARNETVYAFRSGRLENDKSMAERYGLKLKLVWRCRHDSETCDICASMDGQETTIGEAYADNIEVAAGTKLVNGHTVDEDSTFAWSHTSWNDGGQIPSAHVNCRCYFDEIVEAE